MEEFQQILVHAIGRLQMNFRLKEKLTFNRVVACLIGILIFLSLLPFAIWEIRQFGKDLQGEVTIEKNGQPLSYTVVSVTMRRRNWTDFYELSKEKNQLLEESRPHSRWFRTDSHGRVYLSGRAVYVDFEVYHNLKEYYLYRDNLTIFSFFDNEIDIDQAEYVAPLIETQEEYATFLKQINDPIVPEGSTKPRKNIVTCYAEEHGDEFYYSYLKEVRRTSDVLYLRILSDNLEKELVNSIPYEICFHDTGNIFLQNATRTSVVLEDPVGYICILVPKEHSYDVSFYPGNEDWPGMSLDCKAPKPLEPITIRNIRPRHLPTEPFETIVLKRSKEYTPDWKERLLTQRKQPEGKASGRSHLVERFEKIPGTQN